MKKLKLILLLQALILGALTLNAEDCPCEGGTAPYSVDCDGDGTMDACSADDCGPCEAGNPPSAGNACCGTDEYITSVGACCPNGDQIIYSITDAGVAEWCTDCTYVRNHHTHVNCCNSESGTADTKKSVACVCFDCIQADCVDFDWQTLAEECATSSSPLEFCLNLIGADIVVIDASLECDRRVCPDYSCS